MKRAIAVAACTGVMVFSPLSYLFAQAGGGKGGAGATMMAPAPMAQAPLMASCTVGSVDSKNLTFVCSGESYGVSTATVFQLGSAGTRFAGLKAGMAVTVTYHSVGSSELAD